MRDTFGKAGTYTGPPSIRVSALVKRHCKPKGIDTKELHGYIPTRG